MTNSPSPVVAALARGHKAQAPSEDKLVQVRDAVRRARDLVTAVTDLEERLKDTKKRLTAVKQQELPDIFEEVGLTQMTLGAEGNQPEVNAKLRPYYHASIEAGWAEDRRTAAFVALREAGAEPIIRVRFTIDLDPGDVNRAGVLRESLKEAGVGYSETLTVPWATLTAWVRERVESGEPFEKPWETIGATVGRIVDLKPVKQK